MSKRSRDDIDRFFDYGIDLRTRTIYIGSSTYTFDDCETGTDFIMAEKAVKGIYVLSDTEGDINVLMNNPGGDWYHGMAIYDALKESPCNIIIHIFGMAMSMGSVILQAGDVRLLAPNAALLLHYGTNGYYGHSKDFDQAAKENARIIQDMENIYLAHIRQKHPEFTVEELKKKINFDWFMNAREAVKWGLADGIIGEYNE